jgi:drug/metabolite transporter (DMT)-like permease
LDFTTVAIMLTASVLHASWHSLIKSGGDRIGTLAGMGLVASIAVFPAVFFLPSLSAASWAVIFVSVSLHVGYKLCLSVAYNQGDLGQAFPLSRGAVPLFAMLIAFGSLGQIPSDSQLLGILLVSAGILTLTLDRVVNLPRWPLVFAAAGAGLTVACYSVLDGYGTRLAGNWASYTSWLIITDNLAFLTIARIIRGRALWTTLAVEKTRIIASGLLGLASFGIFLWALSRQPVGPVSALRETSVLFAVLIGVAMHREPFSLRRLCGGALIVLGIIRIAA